MTEEQRLSLTIGYGIDTGGYEFEAPPKALEACAWGVWDNVDPDYVPWVLDYFTGNDYWGLSCTVYAHGNYSCEWPAAYREGEYRYRLVASCAVLPESQRECNCHGREVAEIVRGKRVVRWEFGDVSDDPCPGCDRCAGTGLVTAPGGSWALYALAEE